MSSDYWLYYAICSALCIGLYGFAQKMKAEMPHQSDDGFVFYAYIIMLLTGGVGSMLTQGGILGTWNTIFLASLVSVFYTIVVKSRLRSLRYLSSSTYFINFRIISSVWLVFLGVFLFAEQMSIKELGGIVMGFFVFYLLLEKKSQEESLQDVKKGFLYLLIGTVGISLLQSTNKYFASSGANIYEYAFWGGVSGILCLMILRNRTESLGKMLEVRDVKQGCFLGISGLLLSASTVLNNYAFIGGDLAIVYKIISYSLFIPIILSIIVYKESVTKRKLLAFALTILSIFLFI